MSVSSIEVHPDPKQSHVLLTGGADGTARLLNIQGAGHVLQVRKFMMPARTLKLFSVLHVLVGNN